MPFPNIFFATGLSVIVEFLSLDILQVETGILEYLKFKKYEKISNASFVH
jgi:hypothetical protein